MKAIRSLARFRTLSLALLTVALSPSWAQAQSAAAGEFKLPYEVHWQKVVLPPGEYTFSIQSVNLPSVLVLRRQSKPGTALMLVAKGISQSSTTPGHSGLNLVLKGEERTVESLDLGDLGLVLYYGNPGRNSYRTMARVPPATVQVPVATYGH
jgi:hypothetical protein